jgi:hypothetical protein
MFAARHACCRAKSSDFHIWNLHVSGMAVLIHPKFCSPEGWWAIAGTKKPVSTKLIAAHEEE